MKTGTTATGFYYYRDSVAVEMNTGESIVDNLTHAYIITDSDNTAQDLNAAESNFNTTTQKIIIWMHFWKSPSGSIDTVYVKFNDNLTDQEAEDLVNYYFYETMKNWVPEEILNPEDVPVAVREGINSGESRLGNCSLSWKWGYNCLLPEVNDWYPGFRFQAGMAIGLLDGLLGTIQTIYEGGKKVINTGAGWWERAVSYTKEVVSYGIRNRSMLKMFKKVGADTAEKLKESWDAIVNLYKTVKEFINTVASNFKPIVKGLWEGIVEWLGGAIDGEAGPGYDVGVLAFDVVLSAFTGGSAGGAKFLPKVMKWLEKLKSEAKSLVSGLLSEASSKIGKVTGLAKKVYRCKILGKGCFVAGTPVLMAGNAFKNVAAGMALAAIPLAVPIQNVQVDDMVKAYHHEEMYLTASNEDDLYIPGWEEYDYLDITPETWQIGKFEIIEDDGGIVEVEANRPKTWYLENHVNTIGDKANFYMPEIGINGAATLLSLRPTIINTSNFALNEKGQVDRPVITTFKRCAPVVYDYYFSDGSMIGATPEHPFFSVDRNNYIAVGELNFDEQVMTIGEKVVKFIAGKQRYRGELVYNFEVWREHNYYVSGKDDGDWMLVHNLCDNVVRDWINKNFPKIGTKNIKTPGTKHAIKDAKVKQKYGITEICYDDLGFPDFSPFVEKFTDPITGQLKEAAFEINMGGNYSSDYSQANAALRGLTGDPNMLDFPRTINGIEYTWHHHQDGKTMMLVARNLDTTQVSRPLFPTCCVARRSQSPAMLPSRALPVEKIASRNLGAT